ncbi:hypothetical protein ACIBG8_47705 [Nonomuraea sp. NPDC050556]|uniref:hypothetical protein n=1 Tax=Nonomuraea sp. NPDC050556 TaxID=3364369 RepID=UPI0037881025
MATGSRMLLSLVVTVAVAIVAIAAAGTVIAGRVTAPPSVPVSRKTLLWAPGACVRQAGARVELVACNGGDAEVTAIAADPPGLGGCPDDTDDVVRISSGRTACTRNDLDPHPGDPGRGGGVLRAGDCLALDGRERSCATPGWYGRAVAVVRSPATCPGGTLDVLKVSSGVACLGEGGQVLARGSCVARLRDEVVPKSEISRVDCRSHRAWARVTSFGKSPAMCPKSANRYLKASGAFRPVTCLRLLEH